jgi:hypothetical protein
VAAALVVDQLGSILQELFQRRQVASRRDLECLGAQPTT